MSTKLLHNLALAAIPLGIVLGVIIVLALPPSEYAGKVKPLADPSAFEGMALPPDFTLVDQLNRPVSFPTIQGSYTVLAFTFTHCRLACPILNGQIERLAEKLVRYPVKFVSLTVDPTNDTPEHLAKHAKFLGADPERWSFWTGDPDQIQAIVKGLGFYVAIDDNEDNIIQLNDGTTMNNIVHPNTFVVFDPAGQVVGRYNGTRPADVDQLAKDFQTLLGVR